MAYFDFSPTFRPIDKWPGEKTAKRRNSQFKADWKSTLDLLKQELRYLNAGRVVIMVDMPENMIRNDGWPRADAKPNGPGVILSFESKHGPLKYPCDTYTDYKSNLRAIALSLEALRAVDRYGVTRRAEQYTGWKAIDAPRTNMAMTAEQAAEFLNRMSMSHNGSSEASVKYTTPLLMAEKEYVDNAYRMAAKNCHPDTGGNHEDFTRLQEAKRVLDQHFAGKA